MKRKQLQRDPVCGQRVNRNKAHIVIIYKGREYPLCCPKCQSEFEMTPEIYIAQIKRRQKPINKR
jgi:YHS domain-containing protein